MATFKENLVGLKPVGDIKEIILYQRGLEIGRIPNAEGKKGSLQVYANLLGFEDGTISAEDAKKGLELFSEHTEDARKNPGKHPNIDYLLNLKSEEFLRGTIRFAIPTDLEGRIRELNEVKKAGKLGEKWREAVNAFYNLRTLLEDGKVRTAEYLGFWKVNDWVKMGILLGFSAGKNTTYMGKFIDKDTVPPRVIEVHEEIRVVPPSAGIRSGAYVGRGCTLMPPAYVNIGAFVGRGTMAENLVGSCAQVGKNSHLSAGSIIGGVLDPIEATPVILGDDVMLGEGAGVTQGTRLGDLVTLAPGVHISKGTPVVDLVNKVAYTAAGVAELKKYRIEYGDSVVPISGVFGSIFLYGVEDLIKGKEKDPSYGPEIPRGALIIPSMSISSQATLKATPTIVKYISDKKQRSFELEQALRT